MISTAPDPHDLRAPAFGSRYKRDTTGYVRSNQFPLHCGKTLTLINAGQSNTANTTPDTYIIANPNRMDHISIDDGVVYKAQPELLGAESGSVGLRVNSWVATADLFLTANDYDRVILIPTAISGTNILQWQDTLFQRIIVGWRRAKALNIPVDAITFQQGENDCTLTSQADYLSRLTNLIGKVRAAGCMAPWLISRTSWNSVTNDNGIRIAQWSLVNGTDIFQGPDTDTLVGANRNGFDGLHFSAIGRENLAAAWRTAILDAL